MKINIHKGLLIVLLLSLLAGLSCKKDEGGEESLVIALNAKNNEVIPNPSFLLIVEIKSIMPEKGVKIDITLRGESDNANYPQIGVVQTKATKYSVFINNFPRQKYCVCTITVTSISDPTNIASQSFRLASK